MKKPICAPAQIELRVSPRSERRKKIAITTAASAKRTAMYMNTETSASASFTTTNVAPQMSAVKPSARSARKCLLSIDGRVYALRARLTRRDRMPQLPGPDSLTRAARYSTEGAAHDSSINRSRTYLSRSRYPIGRSTNHFRGRREARNLVRSAQPEFYRGLQRGRKTGTQDGDSFRADSRGLPARAGACQQARELRDYHSGRQRRGLHEDLAARILGEGPRAPGRNISGQHEPVFCGDPARCSGVESLQHDLSRIFPLADGALLSEFAGVGVRRTRGILRKYADRRFRSGDGTAGPGFDCRAQAGRVDATGRFVQGGSQLSVLQRAEQNFGFLCGILGADALLDGRRQSCAPRDAAGLHQCDDERSDGGTGGRASVWRPETTASGAVRLYRKRGVLLHQGAAASGDTRRRFAGT